MNEKHGFNNCKYKKWVNPLNNGPKRQESLMSVKGYIGLAMIWLTVAGVLVGVSFAGEDHSKAFLGVTSAEVTSEISEDYGVKQGEGALITSVVSETVAEEVGLRVNDVIVSIDDAKITGPQELGIQIRNHKPGETVKLSYYRGGKKLTVDVELGTQKDHSFCVDLPKLHLDKEHFMGGTGSGNRYYIWDDEDDEVAFCGIVTQDLSEDLADYFKVKEGALISEVVDDSPAEKAGLKAGDVIVRIGDENIEDPGDVRSAIRSHEPDDKVAVVIIRDGKEKTIDVTLSSRKKEWGSLIFDEDIKLSDIDVDLESLEKSLEDLGSIHISLSKKELEDHKIELEKMKQELDEEIKDLRIKIEKVPDAVKSRFTSDVQYVPALDLLISGSSTICCPDFCIQTHADWKDVWEASKRQFAQSYRLLCYDCELMKTYLTETSRYIGRTLKDAAWETKQKVAKAYQAWT